MGHTARYDRTAVENLLASAKEHFLREGYEKASLRKICAGAGVTTGALYFSFENKEDLFNALVNPTMERLDGVLEKLDQQILKENGEHFDEKKFNDFIFRFLIENRDGIRLLMARSEGTHFEAFSEKVHRYVERLMSHYAKSKGGIELDPQVVSILTNMYFTAVSDLISREYTYEEMTEVAAALRICMEQGFYAMLRQQKAKG